MMIGGYLKAFGKLPERKYAEVGAEFTTALG